MKSIFLPEFVFFRSRLRLSLKNTNSLFYCSIFVLRGCCTSYYNIPTSLCTREAYHRPTVHPKGVIHYTLQSEACEKEYEQIVRTPFVVGRGFISRRFICIYRLFSAEQAPALRYFRQVNLLYGNHPLGVFLLRLVQILTNCIGL